VDRTPVRRATECPGVGVDETDHAALASTDSRQRRFSTKFSTQVLLVQSRRLPGWVLPVAGGVLVVVVGVLWYTSALWYYNGFQLPAL
jgi:Family of unknown function (DUF6529)